MRFCEHECRDFPDGEFRNEDGVWFHCPQGAKRHPAEGLEVSGPGGPGPIIPPASLPPVMDWIGMSVDFRREGDES